MEDYGKRLLESLMGARKLKRGRAEDVLAEALESGASIEEVLVKQGHVQRDELLAAKAALFGVPSVDLVAHPPDPAAAAVLPQAMAQRYNAVAVAREGERIVVALADPSDAFAAHYIQVRTGYHVDVRVAYLGDVVAAQTRAYAASPSHGPTPDSFRERVGQQVMRGRVLEAPGPIEETARVSGRGRISLSEAPSTAAAPSLDGNASVKALREIARVSLDLANTLDEDAIIDRILDACGSVFEAEAASLILIDWKNARMYFREARGPVKNEIVNMTLPLDPERSVAAWVAHYRAPASIPDVSADPRHCSEVDEALAFRTRSILAVPVVWGNDVLGVLEIINKADGAFDETDTENACVLAAHTSVALQHALTVQQLHNFFQQAIETLIDTYQAFDPVSREHVVSVARLATAMGTDMQLADDDMETLCYAALLHDIGKVKCADPRDPRHAELGAETLRQVALFSRVVPVVRHHHERFDGSGTPDRLQGEQIPLLARVLAVAEAWFEEGGAAFTSRFGTDFDPALAPVFERALPQAMAMA